MSCVAIYLSLPKITFIKIFVRKISAAPNNMVPKDKNHGCKATRVQRTPTHSPILIQGSKVNVTWPSQTFTKGNAMFSPNTQLCPGFFAGGEIPPGVFHIESMPQRSGTPINEHPGVVNLDGHPGPDVPDGQPPVTATIHHRL